ncbi:hypothetical protein B1H29_33080 [Streptomyces pactum]|uniref:Uncharacterized protein n=2 Tax=Streptomyces pactum TaxID=68249 RepID=A0A1S6JH40_9ACTN|nr:hypothetical protein B1H29_33080 [Streptomyces pactum]
MATALDPRPGGTAAAEIAERAVPSGRGVAEPVPGRARGLPGRLTALAAAGGSWRANGTTTARPRAGTGPEEEWRS